MTAKTTIQGKRMVMLRNFLCFPVTSWSLVLTATVAQKRVAAQWTSRPLPTALKLITVKFNFKSNNLLEGSRAYPMVVSPLAIDGERNGLTLKCRNRVAGLNR